MSFFDWFKAEFRAFWNIIKSVFFSEAGQAKVYQILFKAVLPVVENITKMDWDKDGVVEHSKEEILANFKAAGLDGYDYVTEELLEHLNKDELKRYLAISQTALLWVKGNISGLPKWSVSTMNIILELCAKVLKNETTKAEALKLIREM